MTGNNSATARAVVLLLAVWLLTIAPNIGTRDLWEPEELRYAEVSREMAESGEWALLRINGVIYPDKPPLFFWLICASAKCFGGFHAVAVRVPNIASSILLLLVIYFFGKQLIGESRGRAGLLACLALMTTPFFVWTCAEARMDTTLTLFIALALVCFWRNYETGGRSILLHLLFGLFTGLAVLTKGPIGFLIPFLIGLVFAISEKQPRRILNLTFLAAVGAALGVVLPWLITACVQGGSEFTRNLLFTQNIGRAVQGIRHKEPFYHFFKVVPAILVPWTLFLPAMLYYPFTERDERRRRGQVFALCWFLTVFIFFTLSKGKRTIYMTPLFPAAGLLLGSALDRFVSAEAGGKPARAVRWALGITMLLLPLFCLAVPVVVYFRYPDYLWRASIVAAVGMAGSAASAALFFLRRKTMGLFALMGTIAITWFAASLVILPAVNNEKSSRVMFKRLADIIDRGEPLRIFGSERTGYAVYWGKPIPILKTEQELDEYLSSAARVFCLARQDQFPESLLLVGEKGYVVWRGSCGYRQHILIANRIENVPEEALRAFQAGHPDARVQETAGLTLLASGGVPEAAKGADVELNLTANSILLRLFPARKDSITALKLRFRGLSADSAEVTALSIEERSPPAQSVVEPDSSPLMASFLLQGPCEVSVRRAKAPE